MLMALLALLTASAETAPAATTISSVTWLAVVASMTVLCGLAARRHRGLARWAWALMAAAGASAAVQGLASMVASPDQMLHPIGPDSFGGAVGLMSDALLVAASLLLLRASRANRDRAAVLDGIIILLAAAMAASHFVIVPALQLGDLSPVPFWIIAGQTLSSLLLISAATRLWFSTVTRRQWPMWCLSIGMMTCAAADLRWLAYLVTPELGVVRPLYGIGYVVSAGLIGLAALTLGPSTLLSSDSQRGLSSRWRTIVMLAAVSLIPLLVRISDEGRGGNDLDAALVLPGAVMLTVLIALRVSLLLADHRRTTARNRTLVQISAEDFHSRAEVEARLQQWVTGLTRQRVTSLTLRSRDETDTGDGGPMLPGAPAILVLPLLPGTADELELVAASRRPLSGDDLHSLESLAEVIAACLERLTLRNEFVATHTEQRLGLLLANADDAVLVVDRTLAIMFATPALGRLTGADPSQPRSRSLLDLVSPSDADAATDLLARSVVEERSTADFGIRRSDGTVRHCEVVSVWLADEDRAVITLRDVTEHHVMRDELTRRAFYDPLTGLANRDLFRDRLQHAVSRRNRHGERFALMMLDLDDFKRVNDSMGHPAGDALLVEVARRLGGLVRTTDTASRLGGDEFAIIVEGVSTIADVLPLADRVLARLTEPISLQGREIACGVSIGIVASDDGDSAEDFERNADLALYRAKDHGKGQWAVYRPELHASALRRMSLADELREAIDRGQILPWYQPMVELTTGRLAGIEALARWDHPTRGVILPLEFIDVAEESGLIVDLGRSMIDQSLTDLAHCHRTHPHLSQLRLSINLSPRQMIDPGLISHVRHALDVTGIDPLLVTFEITEGVLLPDGGVPLARLSELRALGVGIAIDDFGTGWSSLAYLRTLPVTGLKLAREFVTGLPDPGDAGLVRTIRELAHHLDLDETVAEGIETIEQRDSLVALGYRFGQGFLLGRPMPRATLTSDAAAASLAIAPWRQAFDVPVGSASSS